jgi:hypothetical protein
MKQLHPFALSLLRSLFVFLALSLGISTFRAGAQESILSGGTNAPGANPPNAPTNLQVLAVSPRKVVLGWQPGRQNPTNVTYTIQRDGTVIQTGVTTTNYTDLKVKPQQTYQYQVQTVDAAGNASPFTPPVEAKTTAEQLVDTPGLLFEVWNDLNPPDIETLLADPRFQSDSPDFRALATAADTRTVYPDDSHDNYGGRLSGFLVPADSAKYELFLRSDGPSRLWLSPDDQPDNLVEIAEEANCCAPFQEPGDPRTSGPITLVSGRRYALQVLWTASTGPDYAQVAWRKVGDPTPAGALYPITSDFLRTPWDPTVGPPAVTNKSFAFPTVGTNATLQVSAAGEEPITYQWSSGGLQLAGATNTSLIVTNVALTNIGAIYTVGLTNTFGSTSASFALIPAGSLFIEAEDFNFGAGLSVTNQPIGMTGPYPGGSYFGQGSASDIGIDYNSSTNAGGQYRTNTLVNVGSSAEPGTLARGSFDVQINHMLLSLQPGDWFNYTRVFPSPAGDYYVFGRFDSSGVAGKLQLDEVTSDATTTNQVLNTLGEYGTTTSTNGFQTVPLVDSAGNIVTVTNWVGEKTLRVMVLPGSSSPNFDYLLFVPTTPRENTSSGFTSVTLVGNNLVLTWTSGVLEEADDVMGPWQPVPNATSPYSVPVSGAHKFYRLGSASSSSGFSSVTRVGNSLVLVWSTGALEAADDIGGPWQTVPNATSPFTVPISGAHKFYRLQ